MYKAVGGSYITDHQKEMNAANTATLRSGCTLPSGKRVDLILYGAGPGQSDIAIDVSFSCIEAHEGNYQSRIEQVEKDKEAGYTSRSARSSSCSSTPLCYCGGHRR